ncbi:vomeronasal type-2 receptor 26-like [Aquarana catesbeiana]|uniref:vomeronasal type-2 receptor 26-like n=1 Tax=Aquarana catesbeiana TaxID=8400 RepID=UPI003CCA4BF3
MAPTHTEEDFSEDSQSAAEDNGKSLSHSNHPLTYANMSIFAADIKSTFSAAITDLKSNLLVLTEKMASAEAYGKQRETAICKLEKINSSHSNHFIEINRHLEDLDNRGRRSNIWVRVIPETVDKDQIIPALQRVFNSLLERPEDTAIKFVPRGQCSKECLPGFRKSVREGYHPCCYNCAPCSEGEISNHSDSELCKKCPENEWPNKAKNICVDKVNEYLSYEEDILVLFFSITSVIFATTSLFILGLFVWFRSTPIVRANNRNLSFILLLSLTLSFLSVFLFLGRPVDITCILQQVTFGIPFTISASSILAKTIMVFIAFKATRPGSSCRKWVGVKLPNTVLLFCSSIQVMNCILWLSISPPFQEYDMDSYPGKILIQCNEGSVIGFYSMLFYMGFLAAVSFVLAFMVRTLPDSFNEAKYITFSMLVFCSVWIAMIPAYLSTRGKYMVAVEIFAILTSSAGILLCMFSPKLYILLLQAHGHGRFKFFFFFYCLFYFIYFSLTLFPPQKIF